MNSKTPYDITYHLVGEQAIPIYMGIKLFPAHRHILIGSSKTQSVIKSLKQELPGIFIEFIEIPAFNIKAAAQLIHTSLAEQTSQLSTNPRILFNLTGGTKLMFVAAYSVAVQHQHTPVYVDTNNKRIDYISGSFQTESFPPVFDSVEPFIRLSGDVIKDDGKTPPSSELKELIPLCLNSSELREFQTILSKNREQYATSKEPFEIKGRSKSKQCCFKKGPNNHWKLSLDSGTLEGTGNIETIFQIVSGVWFEILCYEQLASAYKSGLIKDLRINLKTNWKGEHSESSSEAQELDICFTDGYELTIIECKAGNLTQAHIQKLENLVSKYGGAMGKGILAANYKPWGNTLKRLKNTRNISIISDENARTTLKESLHL